MSTWLRICPMQAYSGRKHREIWISKGSQAQKERRYEVNVYTGKPVDICSLKIDMIEDFDNQVSRIRSTRTSLFSASKLQQVSKCPICGSSKKNSKFRLNIYGGLYHQ